MQQNLTFIKKIEYFMRSLVFFFGQCAATLIIASIGLLIFFAPYRIRYWWITRWSYFNIAWAKLVCGISYQVEGIENLTCNNAIIISNHQSAWETIYFQTILPNQTWVLKKELLYIPFFGWALALLEPIAINRHTRSAARQLTTQGIHRLKQGRWVIIFPEGTRLAPDVYARYSRSGFALSLNSEYPIVPVAHNAGRLWPKNSFIKYPGQIKMVFGAPIYPNEHSLASLQQTTENWINKVRKEIN